MAGNIGHSVAAIRIDGGLFTWGENTYGQLGSSNRITRSSPVQVGTSSWTQVSICDHAAGITVLGRLFTWGEGADGRLGSNAVTSRSSPVQVGTSSWTQVYVNIYQTTAIKFDRTLWGWGYNLDNSLGTTTGSYLSRSSPVQIGVSTGDQFYKINKKSEFWFYSPYDPLNENNIMVTQVAGGLEVFRQIPAKNVVNLSSPTQIGTDTGWTDIVASDRYNYGLKSSS
jgi:hypothetical protein